MREYLKLKERVINPPQKKPMAESLKPVVIYSQPKRDKSPYSPSSETPSQIERELLTIIERRERSR